ncbi:MAG: chemotaxis protein CheX [Ruminococcus sp.]|nr:chemotaxis protein CheX [Ruminococcus sp.]
MFAQFFGGYLLNKKMVTSEDLTQAFEDKKNTRMRLGVLAINAGLMTADQVEHVNITQQSVDKRFGDLAVELGYVTEDQVEALLAQQPTEYLLLGQTLVNNGVLTNAEFEKAIKDYKADNELTDSDLEGSKNESLSKLVTEFYHLEEAANARVLTDYVTMMFKNIIRFIDGDFTPLEAMVIREYDAEYFIRQDITGAYDAITCITADKDVYYEFAKRFAGDNFGDISEIVNETVGEFLNVTNGLFAVNESNELGAELTMTPQEAIVGQHISFDKAAYCIPVVFGFGEVDFIVSAEP